MYQSDYQGGEPLSFDDRNQSIEDIDKVSAPYGRNPITGEAYETPRSIADQNAVLGQTFETDDVDADGNLVQKGIDKVKGLLPEGFDLGSALVKTAINAAIGKPVTLFLDILSDILPKQDPRQIALNDFYKMDNVGSVAEGELMANYNPVSGGFLNMVTGGKFGEPTQYGLQDAYQRRIDTIEKTLANKYPDGDYSVTELDERLAALKAAKAEEATLLNRYEGDVDERDQMLEDISLTPFDADTFDDDVTLTGTPPTETITPLEDDFESLVDTPSDQDIIDRGGGDDIGTGGLDPDRGQQIDRGTSGDKDEVGTTVTKDTPKESTYDAELEDDRDTGGGGNTGNGKIVCTMMNQSYGFGSFRNKIWMKFHKDLSPEYQKGYHKLFLPLVRIAKTNKIVKKVLEHIAVHSTIDMRQATRGKTHLLGRIYRKIILPLCYWAGKHD